METVDGVPRLFIGGKETAPFLFFGNSEAENWEPVLADEIRMAAGRGILENAKKFGYLETYRPEICFEYTMLFYVNTLFSYMVGKGHKSLSFIRKMGNELKEAFPDFADNPYYQERVNAEQKKMIAMQQRSTAAFVLYYKALWTWRNFRKKHFGKK